MRIRLLSLLVLSSVSVALGQAPLGKVRVAVRSNSGPVSGARVTVNDQPIQTGIDGVAEISAVSGQADVTVSKDGFFPAHASVLVVAARVTDVCRCR